MKGRDPWEGGESDEQLPASQQESETGREMLIRFVHVWPKQA